MIDNPKINPTVPENQPTILVVEDDQFLNKVYRSKLAKEGFNAVFAQDGEQGLTMLMQHKPDLMLLDVVMPKMNGFQLLEAVSTNDELKGVKVLVMSNLGQDSDVQLARQLGAVEFIVKSDTSIDEVIALIRQHLAA